MVLLVVAIGLGFTGKVHSETFSTWQATVFTPAQLSLTAISGATANPDGDTFPNLAEYAYALDPFTPNASHEALGLALADPSSDGLLYTYVQRKDATDLFYQIEYTNDLTSSLWNLLTDPQEPNAPVDLGDVWQRTILVPPHFPTQEFLRLRLYQSGTPIVLNDPPQLFNARIHEPFLDVDLTWIDRSNQETGYRIERRPDNTSSWTNVTTTASDTLHHRDNHLASDTLYHFRSRTVLPGGNLGQPSSEFTLHTPLDSDGDNLPDWFETKIGTDPLNADSDGDGLDDGYEVLHGTRSYGFSDLGDGAPDISGGGNRGGGDPHLDPVDGDTDDNGTPDGEEDWDEDGLTNADENLIGTEPWNAYSDGDTVPDGLDAIPTDKDIDYTRSIVSRYAIIELPESFNPSQANSFGLVIGEDNEGNSKLWTGGDFIAIPLYTAEEVGLLGEGDNKDIYLDDQGKIASFQSFLGDEGNYTGSVSSLYQYNGSAVTRNTPKLSSLIPNHSTYVIGISSNGVIFGRSTNFAANLVEYTPTGGNSTREPYGRYYSPPTVWTNPNQPLEIKGLSGGNDRELSMTENNYTLTVHNTKGIDDSPNVYGMTVNGRMRGGSWEHEATDSLDHLFSTPINLTKYYGLVWPNSAASPISLGQNSNPLGISDLDIAVGYDGETTPSLWLGKTGWKRKDIPLYEDKPGDIYKIPAAINSKGLILLDYTTLWANGFTYDLAELASQPSGTITATQLTESGLLLGTKTASSTEVEKNILLLPFGAVSDLNNDGKISGADSTLKSDGAKTDATDEQKEKATEYLFVNDNLSNGFWDKDDPAKPATEKNDDDLTEIQAICPASWGAVWFEFEGGDIAKLAFYRTKECKQTSDDKMTFPFALTTEESGKLPTTLYVRAEGAWTAQVEGKLVMKFGKADKSETWATDKLSLTVVHALGDTKQHRAMVDYIKENNTRYYTARPKETDFNNNFQYVVFLKNKVRLSGINAATQSAKTIDEVITKSPWADLTLITNFSYAFNGNDIESGFIKKFRGKLFHNGVWDDTCSVAYNATGAFLTNPTYIAMTAAGSISFGAGDPSAGTQEGSGGLQTTGSGGAPTIWGWVKAGNDSLIAVGSGAYSKCWGTVGDQFQTLFLKDIPTNEGAIYFGDPDGSVAMALKDNDDNFRIPLASGKRHGRKNSASITGFFKNLAAQFLPDDRIKVYMGLHAEKFRNEN